MINALEVRRKSIQSGILRDQEIDKRINASFELAEKDEDYRESIQFTL